jgi:cobaltochelatase CobS
MDNTQKIQELEALAASSTSAKMKQLFEQAIQREKLKAGVTTKEAVATALLEVGKTLSAAMAMLKSGIDRTEVEREVKLALANAKIGVSNLDSTVTSLLNSQPTKTTLTIINSTGGTFVQSLDIDPVFLTRPLTQLLLSDMVSHNNSYLYGGAGTGKTFTAEELAKTLGWALVEVNCSQFTSGLELLGGQTISGYQEGKVVQAWENKIDGKPVEGCVLLLDELPKIDPNTAGLINAALAKVKKPKATITNGKGEKKELGNLFVIGTGNIKLLETSPDYEANFKQDASLQDRFIGSTYEIFVYYDTEVNKVMKGYLFIWLYMVKVREYIERKKLSSKGFVSIRMMESMRDTYITYRAYDALSPINQSTGQPLLTNPKNLFQSCESFFSLFPEKIATEMKNDTDYDAWKQIVYQKNQLPFDSANISANNFDTPQEIKEAQDKAQLKDAENNKLYEAK